MGFGNWVFYVFLYKLVNQNEKQNYLVAQWHTAWDICSVPLDHASSSLKAMMFEFFGTTSTIVHEKIGRSRDRPCDIMVNSMELTAILHSPIWKIFDIHNIEYILTF